MRSMSRSLTAAVVVVALTVLSVPVAHARPLHARTPALQEETSWLQTALSWLAGFLPGHRDGVEQATLGSTGTPLTSGGASPMTGSCIDPQGIGLRCGGI